MRRLLLLSVAVLCSACTPTHTMMQDDELRSFWDMSHDLYRSYPLRIIMPEGQYVFTDSVAINYSGVECFVSGFAQRSGGSAGAARAPPDVRAQRVWMDMHLLLQFKNAPEVEYAPGFWYFAMKRGVPIYLVGKEIDTEAESGSRLREISYRFNDITALGWRTGYYSPLLDYAVHEAKKELGIEREDD